MLLFMHIKLSIQNLFKQRHKIKHESDTFDEQIIEEISKNSGYGGGTELLFWF
jgi:hypothetical protein